MYFCVLRSACLFLCVYVSSSLFFFFPLALYSAHFQLFFKQRNNMKADQSQSKTKTKTRKQTNKKSNNDHKQSFVIGLLSPPSTAHPHLFKKKKNPHVNICRKGKNVGTYIVVNSSSNFGARWFKDGLILDIPQPVNRECHIGAKHKVTRKIIGHSSRDTTF